MKRSVGDTVDETIKALADHITDLIENVSVRDVHEIAEKTVALAALVSARSTCENDGN